MSKVISLRLKERPLASLQRVARRMGRTPTEAAATLLDEMLRQCEFAFIEFRNTSVGRPAHLRGTRLKVWEIVSIAADYAGDVEATAAHLRIPARQIAAALQYAKAFPDEIESEIKANEQSPEDLERLIPDLKVVDLDAPSA